MPVLYWPSCTPANLHHECRPQVMSHAEKLRRGLVVTQGSLQLHRLSEQPDAPHVLVAIVPFPQRYHACEEDYIYLG